MIKDLHRFIILFFLGGGGGGGFSLWWSRICIVLSFYYLKFLTLKDIASATLMCQMVYFLHENEPVLLKFSVGYPQTPPLLHSVLTLLKKRNKEVQTNSRIKNDLLNTITNPPFCVFFFTCWNLRSEVRTPPPPLEKNSR